MRRLPAWLAALWASLFDITQSRTRYLGRALLLDLPISLPISLLVGLAFPSKPPALVNEPVPNLIIGACVVGPVIETLMMILIFAGLRLVVKRTAVLALWSALIWAGLHSLATPAWGLGILWPFLILSISYLSWETRSRIHAFWMTTALHALHNLVLCAMIIISRGA
jgi:hypothetical protein